MNIDSLKVIAETLMRAREDERAKLRREIMLDAKAAVIGALAAVEREQKRSNEDARTKVDRLFPTE